jgi:hypothetical protein
MPDFLDWAADVPTPFDQPLRAAPPAPAGTLCLIDRLPPPESLDWAPALRPWRRYRCNPASSSAPRRPTGIRQKRLTGKFGRIGSSQPLLQPGRLDDGNRRSAGPNGDDDMNR